VRFRQIWNVPKLWIGHGCSLKAPLKFPFFVELDLALMPLKVSIKGFGECGYLLRVPFSRESAGYSPRWVWISIGCADFVAYNWFHCRVPNPRTTVNAGAASQRGRCLLRF
jgi:hypothetical protein